MVTSVLSENRSKVSRMPRYLFFVESVIPSLSESHLWAVSRTLDALLFLWVVATLDAGEL